MPRLLRKSAWVSSCRGFDHLRLRQQGSATGQSVGDPDNRNALPHMQDQLGVSLRRRRAIPELLSEGV